MEDEALLHGGDIYRNKVDIDFSVNVNPLGMPRGVREALLGAVDECVAYPDTESEALRCAAASFFQVREDEIVFGNGASEIFSALANLIRPQKILIPAPSFSGYEYAARDARAEFFFADERNGFRLTMDFPDMIKEDTDMVFICSPNNPTGLTAETEVIEKAIRVCREYGAIVVLDESFSFFSGKKSSFIPRMREFDNLVIVSSLTKIFCIPGVRLGACFSGNRKLISGIKRTLPEWNLSVFAQKAGRAALLDSDFLEKTIPYVKREREYLKNALERMCKINCDTRRYGDLRIFESDVNFLLLYSPIPLFEGLLERGILVRDCRNFKGLKEGYYRIAVRSRRDNDILADAVGRMYHEQEYAQRSAEKGAARR